MTASSYRYTEVLNMLHLYTDVYLFPGLVVTCWPVVLERLLSRCRSDATAAAAAFLLLPGPHTCARAMSGKPCKQPLLSWMNNDIWLWMSGLLICYSVHAALFYETITLTIKLLLLPLLSHWCWCQYTIQWSIYNLWNSKVGVKNLCVRFHGGHSPVGSFMNNWWIQSPFLLNQRPCIYMIMGCRKRELGPENDHEAKLNWNVTVYTNLW